jgi:hypothetical protein
MVVGIKWKVRGREEEKSWRIIVGRVIILSDIMIRTPKLYSHVDVLVRGSVGVSMHVRRTNETSPICNVDRC